MYLKWLFNRWIGKLNHHKFILLSFPRTGTNFLMSFLVQHPHILEFGEMFNESGLSNEILQDPVTYLKEKIYITYPPEIRAVGFKMFYQHATFNSSFLDLVKTDKDLHKELYEQVQQYELLKNSFDPMVLQKNFNSVWDYLKNDSELRIIHLKRRNKLKTFLSLKRAYVFNEWAKLESDSNQNQKSVFLDYESCHKFFIMASDKEEYFNYFFRNNKMIEVTYEHLCENTNGTIKKIHEFLGVTFHKSKSFFYKQNTMTLPESITNYWELKEKFKKTKWIDFFED